MGLHLPHIGGGGHGSSAMPPKGWIAVRVGGEGEEQQRFLVPLDHLSHPLFQRLLDAAAELYGFDHKGAIAIPCHVDHFRQIQDIIGRERRGGGGATSAAAHHHHHQLPLAACFRA